MAQYLDAQFDSQSIRLRVFDSYGTRSWHRPFYFIWCICRLLVACVGRRIDVAHLHMSFGGSVVRKLALLRIASMFRVPTILHLHGSEFAVFCDRLPPWLRHHVARGISHADRVVVIGNYWRDYLVNTLRISSHKIVLIANGVPLPRLPVDMEGSAEPCRVVYLGALGQRKGTSDLLKALASPMLKHLSWNAVIAGNGDIDRFRAEAAALGLDTRVTIPGWVGPEDARDLLRSAAIFVLPSYNEGLPVALLEAMAMGVPVITTSVGAIPDLNINGRAGFLVPPGSIEDLTNCIRTLMQDKNLRQQFGTEARHRVEDGFTIDVTTAQLASLYRNVVCSKSV
jgi:glycosyltransferase involved in cell wall biosynthesis